MAIEEATFGSTNLESGTYDPETKEMAITYHGGQTYVWDRVDPVMWDRLKSAPSAGRFMNEHFPNGTPA